MSIIFLHFPIVSVLLHDHQVGPLDHHRRRLDPDQVRRRVDFDIATTRAAATSSGLLILDNFITV